MIMMIVIKIEESVFLHESCEWRKELMLMMVIVEHLLLLMKGDLQMGAATGGGEVGVEVGRGRGRGIGRAEVEERNIAKGSMRSKGRGKGEMMVGV
jgi:hypothetical protein